jgi:putative transposase
VLGLKLMMTEQRSSVRCQAPEAGTLAIQGKLQAEVAGALGVSIMTLHRWRNCRRPRRYMRTVRAKAIRGRKPELPKLQFDNSRLRRLVTDLLLEKMKLEEALQNGKHSTRWASQ